MLFSSYVFVFGFLPITLVGYFALSHCKNVYPQRVFLMLASLFFYAYFKWEYLILILASITVNYFCAQVVMRSDRHSVRKLFATVAILLNVFLLLYYKYFDFFIVNVNAIASTEFAVRGILLPLGISFFTIQQISFQVRIYKGDEKRLNFIDYALFVSFFPQLIAGPIVQFDELVPQIEDESKRRFNSENFILGVTIFTVGLFKKIMIADSVAVFVDNCFSNSATLGFVPAWFGLVCVSFQYYFDFSGYSDMSIGLGKMFNFDLPANFEMPLRAYSISDFWKRWHITFCRAITSLVYIPLGGSRKGKARKYLNLMIVFFISGFWHGAQWTCIIWGLMHGVGSVLENILKKPLEKVPKAIRIAATFVFTSASLTVFNCTTVAQAGEYYRGLFNFSEAGISQLKNIVYDGIMGLPVSASVVLAAVMAAVCFALSFRKISASKQMLERFEPTVPKAALLAVVFAVSVMCMSRSEVFIYFNF